MLSIKPICMKDRPIQRYGLCSTTGNTGDIDEAAAECVARELRLDLGVHVRALRVDVSKADNIAMVQAAKDRWDTVHILVNNAWGGET
jgi:NAD(P)-dependent dehydrogenase (short-subunit alcohol dehydrogenase family)